MGWEHAPRMTPREIVATYKACLLALDTICEDDHYDDNNEGQMLSGLMPKEKTELISVEGFMPAGSVSVPTGGKAPWMNQKVRSDTPQPT